MVTKEITRLQIKMAEGGIVPWGWGLAYWRENEAIGIFMPIPLNLVVRTARVVYFWMARGGGMQDRIDKAYLRGYDKGREDAAIIYAMRSEEDKEKARKEGHDEAVKIMTTVLRGSL